MPETFCGLPVMASPDDVLAAFPGAQVACGYDMLGRISIFDEPGIIEPITEAFERATAGPYPDTRLSDRAFVAVTVWGSERAEEIGWPWFPSPIRSHWASLNIWALPKAA